MAPRVRRDLRPLNVPRPIRMQLAAGQPRAVWRSERPDARAVVAVQDRWRIDDEWWREHAIARVYYTLLLDDGSLLDVYHDLLSDAWFEQRG